MSDKKGISPIIATVLLLGFAIALATTVFLWMHGQTETMSESTVEYVEGEMQCQNVRINVVKSDSITCTCDNLSVSNKGYITINQLTIRAFNPEGSSLYPVGGPEKDFLPPQSSNCNPPACGVKENVPTVCSNCTKVEVMPIIKIGGGLAACKDKAITVNCELCAETGATCSDGTLYGQCSSSKPKYCDNGNLVNSCSVCGCPSGYTCQLDGSCLPTAPLFQGYYSPDTVVNDNSIGNLAWTDVINAKVSDDSYATATPSGTQTTNYLKTTNFGFTIPTDAVIKGIEVGVEKKAVAVSDSYTKLLLHDDGTDGSTTFTDSSASAHAMTANGNTQIDTAQSKFGGASGSFDGAGDYLSSPDSDDWNFVNADFTVDFWVRFSTVGSATFYGQRTVGYVTYIDYDNDDHLLYLVWWTQDPSYRDTLGGCAWTPSANTWYHIAVVRSGNTLYMFINGVSQVVALDGFVTMTNIPNVATVGWSEVPSLSTHYLNGWLDEFRISKGIARWTSDFTPPTSPYPYGNVQDNRISIVKSGGSIGTTNKAVSGNWLTSDETATYGSSDDLWGETWTPADINSANFGVAISASASSNAYIDHTKIKVYYTQG